jgi:hypothetical protein
LPLPDPLPDPLPLPPDECVVVGGGAALVVGGGAALVVGVTGVTDVVVGVTAAAVVVGVTAVVAVVVVVGFGFGFLCSFFFFLCVFLGVVVVVDGVDAAEVELDFELLDPQPATIRAAAIAVISSTRFMVRAPLFARRLRGLRVQEASGELTRVELLSCGRGLVPFGHWRREAQHVLLQSARPARRRRPAGSRRESRSTGESRSGIPRPFGLGRC